MERTMEELLQEMSALQEQLKQFGIEPEKADQFVETVNQYIAAKEEIIRNRDIQFEADARELAVQIQAATNKNIAKIAAFLRQFAEHVAEHVASGNGRVVDLVDYVPPFYQEES